MPTILLIHPHAIICQGIQNLLGKRYQFIVVEDKKQIRAILKQEQIDMVLLSLEYQKEEDSLFLLQDLAGKGQRVVMLSSGDIDHITRACIMLGAYGFLDKSQGLDILEHTINQVLAGEYVLPPALVAKVISEPHEMLPALTKREIQVLDSLFYFPVPSNEEIAAALFISPGRVKNINTQLFEKFGVEDRHNLAHEVRRRGYFPGLHLFRLRPEKAKTSRHQRL